MQNFLNSSRTTIITAIILFFIGYFSPPADTAEMTQAEFYKNAKTVLHLSLKGMEKYKPDPYKNFEIIKQHLWNVDRDGRRLYAPKHRENITPTEVIHFRCRQFFSVANPLIEPDLYKGCESWGWYKGAPKSF